MWYNPVIYTTNNGFTSEQILFAMYQHQVATVSLLFSVVIFYFAFKFLVWFLPSYWHRRKNEKDKK